MCAYVFNRGSGIRYSLLQVYICNRVNISICAVSYISRAWWYIHATAGRRPATHSLGLSLAGVGVDGEGKVVVDEADRTSASNIYAIGDAAKVRANLSFIV